MVENDDGLDSKAEQDRIKAFVDFARRNPSIYLIKELNGNETTLILDKNTGFVFRIERLNSHYTMDFMSKEMIFAIVELMNQRSQ